MTARQDGDVLGGSWVQETVTGQLCHLGSLFAATVRVGQMSTGR